MKSKFAKFIDATVGACLIFFAAIAVFRYFIPTTDLVVFCAASVTLALCLVGGFKNKQNSKRFRISKAADDMFFEFMFLPDNAPAKLIAKGLKAKDIDAATVGAGVYVGDTAVYTVFSDAHDQITVARLIAKAKHHGAKKLIVLCKTPPPVPNVDGIEIKTVVGDDVYKLFASLGALPEKKYSVNARRQSALKGAFSSDKIIRYVILAVAFFFVARFSRSIVTFICAVSCAAFALIGMSLTAARAIKKKKVKN